MEAEKVHQEKNDRTPQLVRGGTAQFVDNRIGMQMQRKLKMEIQNSTVVQRFPGEEYLIKLATYLGVKPTLQAIASCLGISTGTLLVGFASVAAIGGAYAIYKIYKIIDYCKKPAENPFSGLERDEISASVEEGKMTVEKVRIFLNEHKDLEKIYFNWIELNSEGEGYQSKLARLTEDELLGQLENLKQENPKILNRRIFGIKYPQCNPVLLIDLDTVSTIEQLKRNFSGMIYDSSVRDRQALLKGEMRADCQGFAYAFTEIATLYMGIENVTMESIRKQFSMPRKKALGGAEYNNKKTKRWEFSNHYWVKIGTEEYDVCFNQPLNKSQWKYD